MRINPQSILNSPLGIGTALVFGRSLPPVAGYRLANSGADWIASRKEWGLIKAIRANQWVVKQGELTPGELDQAVRDTLRHIAHSIYDFYHYYQKPNAIIEMFTFNPAFERLIARQKYEKEGVVMGVLHLGNFDLALHTVGLKGMRAMVLSMPNPNPGYRWQNKIRNNSNMEIVPISQSALRQAVDRLEAGGMVLAALDRPVQSDKYQPCFFGRPASLPLHYVSLAVKARVPVVIAGTFYKSDGLYHCMASEPVYVQPFSDRREEMLLNAEAVLRVAEGFINQEPRQWAMPYPVWPETLDLVP